MFEVRATLLSAPEELDHWKAAQRAVLTICESDWLRWRRAVGVFPA